MPYSILGSTKILIHIYFGNSTIFFILVGTLCVCEFAMIPGVYILLCPPGRKGTLLPTHSAAQSSKRLELYDYGKTIAELENNTNNRKRLFMVVVI